MANAKVRIAGYGHRRTYNNLEEDLSCSAGTVVQVNEYTKVRLLLSQTSSLRSSEGGLLLEAITQQDPDIAAFLGLKSIAVQSTPLRFVMLEGAADAADISICSYIAISYCWPKASPPQLSTWPFSAAMVAAINAELHSDLEGVWIDQLCINQDNEAEKAVAIGAMDVIYKRARLVVILLEDIVLNIRKFVTLQTWNDTYEEEGPWQGDWQIDVAGTFPTLVRILWKIYSSRWFTRAWCTHEYLVGVDHIFLLNSSDNGIIRITSALLIELTLLEATYRSVANDFQIDLVMARLSHSGALSNFVRTTHLMVHEFMLSQILLKASSALSHPYSPWVPLLCPTN